MPLPFQDWAEPKEEEQAAWDADKAAQARALDAAGKRNGSYGAVGIGSVQFDPLPQVGGWEDGGVGQAKQTMQQQQECQCQMAKATHQIHSPPTGETAVVQRLVEEPNPSTNNTMMAIPNNTRVTRTTPPTTPTATMMV